MKKLNGNTKSSESFKKEGLTIRLLAPRLIPHTRKQLTLDLQNMQGLCGEAIYEVHIIGIHWT